MEALEIEELKETLLDPIGLCMEILHRMLPSKVTVTEDMPADHPRTPYVMPSITGGDEDDFVSKPIITLTCWDSADESARRLAQSCAHDLALAAQDHPLLSAAQLVTLSRDEYAPRGFGCYEAQVKLTINKE